MKSKDQAQAKCKSIINFSTSKMQFSFGRDSRFKQKSYLSSHNIKFYDLPSQITKRAAIFGKSVRKTFADERQIPPPTRYNPKQIGNKSSINFASSRQQCKANSIFNTTTIDYPGPGNYNPQLPKDKLFASIKGKIKTLYDTVSPGPKYNFDSLLLDNNKVLSKDTRKGSVRIVLPSNKSRLKTEGHEETKRTNLSQVTEGVITRRGNKTLGLEGQKTFITTEKRFASSEPKKVVPGPGQYKVYTEFIQNQSRVSAK